MKPLKEQSYYEILEVDPSASMAEIRASFERLNRYLDEDNVALYPLVDTAQLTEHRAMIVEAMEFLTDAELRVEYDRSIGLPPGIPAEAPSAGADVTNVSAEPRVPAEPNVPPAMVPSVPAETETSVPPEIETIALPELSVPPEASVVAEAPVEVTDQGAVPDAPPANSEQLPTQLVMQDLVARAEAVHSTLPNLSVSWLPHVPAPLLSSPAATVIPASNGTRAPLAEAAEVSSLTRPPDPEAPAPENRGEVAAPTPQPPAPVEAPPIVAEAPEPQVPTHVAAAPDASTLTEATPSASPPIAAPPVALLDGSPVPVPPAESVEGPLPEPPAPRAPPPIVPQVLPRALDQAPHIAQESAINAAETALAQLSMQVASRAPREVRPRALDIPADAEFNGELLRQVRKSRGYSLAQVADRTRITLRHLENVEADRYDALPPTVYLRGILMSLARELGLDSLRVSKSYLSLVDKQRGGAR